jgi:hypothetical protein
MRMQFSNNKERIASLLGIGVVIGFIFFAVISNYYDNSVSLDTTYVNVVEKKRILAQLRIDLLKSVEMEKNAVMSLTNEESLDFAGQSRAASATVEQDLKFLRALIDAVPLQDEKKLVGEFANCWTELGKLDQVILEIAVQSTNLKAARLSKEKGAASLQQFEQALEKIAPSFAGTANDGRGVSLICQAMTAALKMYTLHSPHIAEASDKKMDQIEMQMKTEENKTSNSLDELAGIIGEENRDSVMQAKTAFVDFLEVTSKVIELSRQNSNIKSLELSLGKKRTISAQCDEILATFQEVVQSRNFKARK